MISPGDYANSAHTDLESGDTASALVHAVLALASALENLAYAHEKLIEKVSVPAPPKKAPRDG